MSNSRFKRVLLLLGMLSMVLGVPTFGQFESATVIGTVRDPTGAVIVGSQVTLENLQTGVIVTGSTDESGNYQFFNVRIGTYRVKGEKEGFTKAQADQVTVTVNARQRVDLTLQVGENQTEVTVTADVKLIETDSSDRGQVIRSEQIVNLPLNGRSYADLALLAPGVRSSSIASSRDASFNVNGLRSSLNNFVVDGIDNNAYGTSNQGFSNQVVQLSPDAVEEFKVQTNNYSAEFGRAGGAVINASVRSGTNQFHGAAWNFMRNTSLNAVGFFKPRENRKPTLIQNQFGGAIGGPIKKDKMFIFGDYEGYRRVSRTLTLSTLPTLAERGGTLGIPVVNPLTGEQFLSGVVPQSAMTAFARKVLSQLPDTNRPGNSNNYEALPRRVDRNDKADVRFDYYINNQTTSFARYSHRLLKNLEPAPFDGLAGGDANGNVRVLNKQFAFGLTHNLNPTSLIEFRMGIALTEGGKSHLGIGLPNAQEAYGITGLPTDPRVAGGLYSQLVSGYTNWGVQNSNPQFQNPFVVNPKVNFTKVLSRHTLKAGYEYQAINTEIDDFNPKYGRDQYASRFSRPAGNTSSNNLYNVADFMFGLRSNYDLNNNIIVNYRQRMQFLYLQDDFKVNPNLTLNMGLRYEFATPQWERDNILSNFDPVNRTLIRAQDGSISDRALVDPDKNNFAPRIGFAYNLTPKTVIRSGFGISYIHFNRLGGENLLAYNLPGIINPNIAQQPGQGPCAAGQAPQTCFRPTQDGYPAGFLDVRNVSTATARTNFIPQDTRTGYTQSWHLTVQRELAENLLLDVAYVGNRSNKLVILTDYNYARLNNPGENLTVNQRRRVPGFAFIQMAFPGGFANYHALQAKLERRFSGGLYLLNSFTWSKAMDNASGHLEVAGGDSSRVNLQNLAAERGLSGYNQPFNNTTTLIWDLPVGKGRALGSDWAAPINMILGGWRVTAINNMWSGLPVNLTYGPVTRQQAGDGISYRPNISGDPLTPSDQREWFNYLNSATVQIVASDVGNPFGNAGRNIVSGPALFQTDLGLHKAFPLPREGMSLEFRSEFFNLLNHTNFQQPNGNRSSNAYGQITSTFIPRQIQFALKLIF